MYCETNENNNIPYVLILRSALRLVKYISCRYKISNEEVTIFIAKPGVTEALHVL
jgi:hypothetical protein